MERRVQKDSKVMWILKSLLAAYIITGILLIVLAMLLYKFELNLWGMGIGVLYFALLLVITLGIYRGLNGDSANLLTTFILCAGGGMAGGMVS